MEVKIETAIKLSSAAGKSFSLKAKEILEGYCKATGIPEPKDKMVDVDHFGNYFKVNLRMAIEGIKNTYLTRTATRMYILRDYPEKLLADPKKKALALPAYLKELLSREDRDYIKRYWIEHYGIAIGKRNFEVKC